MAGQVELVQDLGVSPWAAPVLPSPGDKQKQGLWSEDTLPSDCSPTLVGACSKCRCLGPSEGFCFCNRVCNWAQESAL